MKFVQILEEPIEPGGLVEWTPRVADGFTPWSTDTRLPSHNHEQHLRSALEYRLRTRREGGRESWLGLVIEFDEPLSIPAIRAALSAWIDRHEVLRSHVVVAGDTLRRVTVEPGEVELAMGRIGWYSASEPMMEQLAGAFDRATAPLQWPAYMFATVGREASFTLLFAADHSLVDGYSLIMAQQELVTMYRAARDRRDPEVPEVGSYVDFSAQERRLADQAGADHPAVATWREFLSAGPGGMPSFFSGRPPVDPFEITPYDPDSGQVPQQAATGLLLDDAEANQLTAVCSEAGGTLTAGVLAAFAIVYHQTTGDPEFRCVLPRHTRDDARWLQSLGWFVAVAPFCLDMSDSPTFDQAVTRATAELKRTRQGASLPYLKIAELLGRRGEPRFVISFIDTRYAPGAAEADAGRAYVLRSHSYSTDEVYIWINRTPGGMRVSARFPPEEGSLFGSSDGAAGHGSDTNGPGVKYSTQKDEGPSETVRSLGPVQSYLRNFAEYVRAVGNLSNFGAGN